MPMALQIENLHIVGSRPEWCISSMIYRIDTPFWSEILNILEFNDFQDNHNESRASAGFRYVMPQWSYFKVKFIQTIIKLYSLTSFFFFFFFFAFPSYISGVHHFWMRFLRM